MPPLPYPNCLTEMALAFSDRVTYRVLNTHRTERRHHAYRVLPDKYIRTTGRTRRARARPSSGWG
jgi:hypothetical protein